MIFEEKNSIFSAKKAAKMLFFLLDKNYCKAQEGLPGDDRIKRKWRGRSCFKRQKVRKGNCKKQKNKR